MFLVVRLPPEELLAPKCLREHLLKSQWNRSGRGPAFGCRVNAQRQYYEIISNTFLFLQPFPYMGKLWKKKGGFKSLDFHSLYLKKVPVYVCFSNPFVKFCSSITKGLVLLQNYHCSCQKIPKLVQVLRYINSNNYLSSVENSMRLWNPAVPYFNNPNFILLKVTQRPYVWGTRLLTGRQCQSRSWFFGSHVSPKQNKIRKEEALYFNLSIFKALFILKEMQVVKAEDRLLYQTKKWVRCGGILHGKIAR